MANPDPLLVNTAGPETSIWREVELKKFRQNISNLLNTTSIPGHEVFHHRKSGSRTGFIDGKYVLPFEVERRLSDDFALLASFEEGSKTVTAATLEEDQNDGFVIVRLAANNRLHPTVGVLFNSVIDVLQDCAELRTSRAHCQSRLLRLIVEAHRSRIHAKLRSSLWKPKMPGQKGGPRLHQQVQKFLTHCGSKLSSDFQSKALDLRTLYKTADKCIAKTETEYDKLDHVICRSHEFCLEMAKLDDADTIFDDSRIRPIKKLARYYSMCDRMSDAAKRYRRLFRQLKMQELPAYQTTRLPALPDTSEVACRVHAEMNMLVHFAQRLTPHSNQPRVIGVSKAACYLCSLFIHSDGAFHISRTHGKLYVQWTVPDTFAGKRLASQRKRISRTLQAVDSEVCRVLEKAKLSKCKRRGQQIGPNESNATLAKFIERSLLSSEAETIRGHHSSIKSIGSPKLPQSVLVIPALSSTNSSKRKEAPAEYAKADQDESEVNLDHGMPPQNRLVKNLIHPKDLSPLSPRLQSSPFTTPRRDSRQKSPAPSLKTLSAQSSSLQEVAVATSSSIVDSWEYPLTYTLTPDLPLRAKNQSVHMTFELEAGGPSAGSVQVTNEPKIDEKAIRHTVDVRKLEHGESRQLHKNESEDELVVNLQNGKGGGMTQVRMKWD